MISEDPEAGILREAARLALPHHHLEPGPFRTKLDPEAERAWIQCLKDHEVNCVVLAGFMRILKGSFLEAFPGKVLNVHPSLLPSFPGLRAWQQALDHGVCITGCTVHLVDPGIDTGPILAQQAVEILPGESADHLHDRIQEAEAELYPRAIRTFIQRNIFPSET